MSERSALISEGNNPRRSLLRFVFYNAYRGVREAAARLDCQPWDVRAIREYFLNKHNEHVDKAKGKFPESVIDPCRVKVGKIESVIKKGKESFAVIRYADGRSEQVIARYFPAAKKGDQVAVHFRTIVDNLEKTIAK